MFGMVKPVQGLSFPAGLGFPLEPFKEMKRKLTKTKEDKKKWKPYK